MQERQFREDLFYRLSGVTITLPPLGQRTEDIPELVKYFMHRSGPELGIESPSIQPEAIAFLQSQAWPGNVRELENVVRQSLVAGARLPDQPGPRATSLRRGRESRSPLPIRPSRAISPNCWPAPSAANWTGVHARMIEDMERELYTRAIQLAEGNQAKAARWLGVTRTTMREKLIRFGLRPAGEKPEQP